MNQPYSSAFLVCTVCLLAFPAAAQPQDDSSRDASIHIASLESAPSIDGSIVESEWSGATITDQPFLQFEPEFGRPSPFRTVVRVGQTDKALYFAFEAYDPEISRLGAAITQRDGHLAHDDAVGVLLDTFKDGRTAYLFLTNALATQEDARIVDNGRTEDVRWDAAWRSAATRHEDRWTVEIEIPFSILKFTGNDNDTWGIDFVRTVPRRLEMSLWSEPSEMAYRVSAFGQLQGVAAPAPQDTLQLIPYIQLSLEEGDDTNVELGGDIRWRPSSQFGVDLTLNPDFALVEADVETINLTRFELRIPEKRPFFLEGNEMYEQRIAQFYSRRIGDISWGAKTNGKLAQTDFSAIVTSEDRAIDDGLGTERADYGIVRFQHSLGRGSNIGVLGANRRLLGENAGSTGLDSTLFFTDTLGMTAQLMRVHGPTSDGGLAWFVRPAWDTSTSHFHVRYTNLDEGIKGDLNTVGFLSDDDRKEIDSNFRHVFWLGDNAVEKVLARVNYNRYWSQANVLRSWELESEVNVTFRNGWEIKVKHRDEFQLFEKEFRNDRTTLYVWWDGRDGRLAGVYAGAGHHFDSDLILYSARVEWPFGDRWRLVYDVTGLRLDPDPETASTVIHVFETTYSFHADLYAKLFVQTNSAITKENIQVLWVWRFKPPFGSLQVAYQRGTSEQGEVSSQGDTLFAKLSWVF